MAQLPFVVVPLPFTVYEVGNERSTNPASHLGEFDNVGMTWRTNGTSAAYVRGDFGSAKLIDFASMIWANALPGTNFWLGLSNMSDFSDAYYSYGATTFIQPSITRTDGLYSGHYYPSPSIAYRYFQVNIMGHTGDFEAAMLVLGKRLTPATYYSAGFQFGVDDLGSLDISPNGVAEETAGRIMRSLEFQLAWESATDFESKWRPLVEQLGKRRVALWCFDPTADIYRQNRTYLGWLKQSPFATIGEIPGKAKMDFQIRSMI
jgi:hypothetical protein